MATLSIVGLVIIAVPVGYLLLLAIASVGSAARPVTDGRSPATRFIIAVPAHDEERVIGETVRRLRALEYPSSLFTVHVVADHCSDGTADAARDAGAIVHERNVGARTGKGTALSWLFERVVDGSCDAVVIFDSDTLVAADFLRVMDARLAQGDDVIQGQHIIRNSKDGWFPALVWSMFIVDNRFQNLGRANLGWSAKLMGDSICVRADLLRRLDWGDGLADDYQFRHRLLLEGIKIKYEPFARGYGEAPRTLVQARAQRARWIRGVRQSNRRYARQLLERGIRQRDPAVLDAALQAHLPSYSTLTVACMAALLVQTLVNWLMAGNVRWELLGAGVVLILLLVIDPVVGLALELVEWVADPVFAWELVSAWALIAIALLVYPFAGLALEKAPFRAYVAISTGPLFVLWRTWLTLATRFGGKAVNWVRTAHGEPK